MTDSQVAERPHLAMRWVPVTDERGRTRLQAEWFEVAPAPSAHHAA
jgi:hypothetical protein